ncbi:hypothetical protein A5893_06800 [Pedobacter psychrophilus]|uniref:Uncharacterized protein n=1 Tax=Pedobacter psychrophilus TaxID=1826909 RepID=A0A179DIC9_9SPHI|nr:hypothetical protein [Pedobacter psychrophilus]OAQ40644.1 hypothetical protein A5893_06800 [Pedobacter psychrophilus]
MLRKSIPTFKIGLIITAIGLALYFFNDDYGKFIMGIGMFTIAIAMILYMFFMFRRYGEKKKST